MSEEWHYLGLRCPCWLCSGLLTKIQILFCLITALRVIFASIFVTNMSFTRFQLITTPLFPHCPLSPPTIQPQNISCSFLAFLFHSFSNFPINPLIFVSFIYIVLYFVSVQKSKPQLELSFLHKMKTIMRNNQYVCFYSRNLCSGISLGPFPLFVQQIWMNFKSFVL